MTDIERLIELLYPALHCNICDHCGEDGKVGKDAVLERVADYLIKHGVIVPPCKVGDCLYYIKFDYAYGRYVIRRCKVMGILFASQRNGRSFTSSMLANNGVRYRFADVGKTVFLTREEAKKALEKRRI